MQWLRGILEYLSQNNDCADFLSEEERFKYIDVLSILEFINLISVGISSYTCKLQVPNDIGTDNKEIPPQDSEPSLSTPEVERREENESQHHKIQHHNYNINFH
jgi:hypothetical protein